MTRRTVATLLTVGLLVIAGCSAPSGSSPAVESPTASLPTTTDAPPPTSTATPAGTSTPTPVGTSTPTPVGTSTPANGVTVYGELPVNATLIWERVETLLGGTYEPPVVAVRERTLEPRADQFAARLGLDDGIGSFDDGRVRASYLQRTGRVRISPGNGSPEQVARILAHEYVHAVQFGDGPADPTTFLDRVTAREGVFLQRALTEGSAVYIEDAYTREYLGFSAIEQRCAEYRAGTPYERYAGQVYCFGGQYFAETLDSPADLLDPDVSLPNTTEQVLHPGRTEEPANLTVVDETPAGWHTPASFDRQGELFVRTVLGVELPEERAIDAADGWGNDRLVRVAGDTEGYVWVLRWDTDGDAAEFEAAFAEYLDARGNETTDGWRVDDDRFRLTTVDDRTVAIVTGNETFVEAVTIAGEGENVTVSKG